MAGSNNSASDKKISFSIQEIITYGLFLITFGASVYTFFQALPKLDKLNDETTQLDKNIAISDIKLEQLKSELEELKHKK